jgi:2-dehydro-3-deoxy-D-gluconate 5-dehydrogenase
MDVTVEAECKAVVAETVKRHGRLDILVNNAGGGANTGVPPSPPDEMAVEGFRKIIDANLTSTFMLSQAAYPEMKKAGGGKIINIGSMASYIGGAMWTAYGPAKSGIVQLSKNCASAWANDNIQVNTILPGYIDTDMTKRLQTMTALHERALGRTAAGRLVRLTISPASRHSLPVRRRTSSLALTSRWTAACCGACRRWSATLLL